MRLAAIVASVGVALLVASGCWRTRSNPVPSTEGPDPAQANAPGGQDVEAGPFAAGRKVFESNGCVRCHAIEGKGGPAPGGDGPKKMGKGPDLGHVGTKHPREWIIEHVRDAKAHNPKSRMPRYQGKIGEDDLGALGDYLASLK